MRIIKIAFWILVLVIGILLYPLIPISFGLGRKLWRKAYRRIVFINHMKERDKILSLYASQFDKAEAEFNAFAQEHRIALF